MWDASFPNNMSKFFTEHFNTMRPLQESLWTSTSVHRIRVRILIVPRYYVYLVCWSNAYTWQLYSEQCTCMSVSPRRKRIAYEYPFSFPADTMIAKTLRVCSTLTSTKRTNTLNSFSRQRTNWFVTDQIKYGTKNNFLFANGKHRLFLL